ncbi:hypothetical protein B0A55_01991 [Friedmanniomyces simplex]|uniref:Major facilitator superfamily (MFS) profile domain-containing protein n=1 Tax=Friedmanniomyces simplex TaxID=329884 RepID=A0A4V5NIX9_9PEZI|nr:hypothetical protein B0A55_01991 [Friedmanniomyces simplex]
MKETAVTHHDVESDHGKTHVEPQEFLGYDDPHRAALEDNPEHAEKLTWSVALSALFLGTSFTGPIIFGFILVTPILVQLGQKIGGATITFWIPSGWGAAAAVGFSIAGRLSDIFAHSMNQLIAGEVILGASIGTVSVAYAGISEILPNKYRGIGLAWTEFNLSTWAVPGTLLANAILSDASWRIMFYIAIGYGVFSMIGTFIVYFPPSHPRPDGKTKWQQFKELDFVGAFLFVAGLAVFLFGLNVGGNQYPWKSGSTLAPLILGLVTFLGAFAYDFMVPKDPLFPWYLFKNFREFSALPILVFVAGMVFFAASALNAQTILYLYTPNPIKIGLYSLPSGAAQLIGGVFVPALVSYIRHVNYQLVFAVFMQTLFFGLAATVTPNNIHWLMACQFFAMFAFGWITLNCYTTASLNVPQKDLGVAIGLIGTFRSVGGSIGTVIFSSIFTQVAAKQVAAGVSKAALAGGVPAASIGDIIEAVELTLVGVPGATAKLTNVPTSVFNSCVAAARLGYAYGFRMTWLASIPFGVIAVLCAIAVRDPSKYFTNHVEVHLNEKVGGKYEANEKTNAAKVET